MDISKLIDRKRDTDEIWVTDFNADAALEFRDRILDASKLDPMRPIVVYIHSYGGAVDALASMIETMDEVPNPIVTVCQGVAMSCGAMLLSHGDVRFIGKHSRVMIHEVSGGTVGDVHDIGADAQEMKRLNKYFMNLLAKNCGIKGGYDALRKIIKDQDGRDRYMNAEEALKFGIVDAVGMPKINRMKLYQVEVAPPKDDLAIVAAKEHKGKKSETKRGLQEKSDVNEQRSKRDRK
jgi:ATP-dependent Clp endopeptidase proteolytic subunit ClpP